MLVSNSFFPPQERYDCLLHCDVCWTMSQTCFGTRNYAGVGQLQDRYVTVHLTMTFMSKWMYVKKWTVWCVIRKELLLKDAFPKLLSSQSLGLPNWGDWVWALLVGFACWHSSFSGGNQQSLCTSSSVSSGQMCKSSSRRFHVTAGRLMLEQEQISGCSISYLMASMLLLLPQREFKRVIPFRGVRPPFHTQWTEPQCFFALLCLSAFPLFHIALLAATGPIQNSGGGMQSSSSRLLLISHSNRSIKVERGKESPFFLLRV